MPSERKVNMDSNKEVTHLVSEERRIIETGIRHGSTKTAIAKNIGKDNSTVGKEIKLHRKLKFKCSLPRECSNYRHCKYERFAAHDAIVIDTGEMNMREIFKNGTRRDNQ